MSNIDKITNAILAEAQDEAQAILDQAAQDNEKYLAGVRAEVELELDQRVKQAEAKAQVLADRIVSGARIEARDQVLAAQQGLVDRVLEQAGQVFMNMSDEALANYIQKSLQSYTPQAGDVLLLPVGRDLKLECDLPIEHDPELRTGFAVKRSGITDRYDFILMLEDRRDDLERAILKFFEDKK